MHRAHLINLLNRYSEFHPEEAACLERFITFVEKHDNCFERSLLEGHVTGSAWLVNRLRSHVLLTHHRKLNQWFQLGGHADGESCLLTVATKEAQEESGIINIQPISEQIFDIDIHLIPARKEVPAHYHYDVRFVLETVVSDVYTVSDESLALCWVAVDRVHERTQEPSMLRMQRKFLSKMKQQL